MAAAQVIVVGAGAGGLAAAADLAGAGLDVTVLDRAPAPGGKMRRLPVGGFDIDAGPTVFTMRWVFEGLFQDAGVALDEVLDLAQAEVLARHAWTDGGQLDLFADAQASVDAISAFAGAADGQAYRRFLQHSAEVYRTLEAPFMRSERPRSTLDLVGRVGLRGMPGLARTQPVQSMWQALGSTFRDPRLRQLFGRYATYVGASPLQAPATLVLIAHVEQAGVWLVRGGMGELARQMQQLGERRGATFRFDTHVREILVEGGRVRGVLLEDGERLRADHIVFNGDSAALAGGLLGGDVTRAAPTTPRSQRSLSAITWCVAARPRGFELQHHNVFFASDYPAEFRRIFEDRRMTETPTVYLCAQAREARMAAAGAASVRATADGVSGDEATAAPEPMLLLVNAPADGDRPWPAPGMATEEQARGRALAVMAACGLRLEESDLKTGTCTTPAGFAKLFPGTGGALYGRANHGPFGIFERPSARLDVPGLYLAGGSAHPGAGVPMATLSGRLAAGRLLQDLGRRPGGARRPVVLARAPAR